MELAMPGRRPLRDTLVFEPGERVLLAIVLGMQLMAFLSATALQREVHWLSFLIIYLAALGLIMVGAYIRGVKNKPRLALAVSAVGFFMAFPAAFSVFSYSLLPLTNPMVDAQLTEIGRWFGYDWKTFFLAMMDYPQIMRFLGIVYHSAFPQMLIAIVTMSLYNRPVQLHRLLFVGMIALLPTIALWWIWPSVGYVGVLPYTKEALAEFGYYFGPDRGGLLTRLLQEGPGVITRSVITGVVGFPSYHIVMALIVTWYMRGTILFIPVLLLNLAMIPATLLHGGHHLVDLVGGLAVFVVVAWIACKVIPKPPQHRSAAG